MPDRISAGPVCGSPPIKEAVCINTKKVYDSCRYKDCQQDVRVYLTRCGQEVIDRALSVKARTAELLWTFMDVEPVPFNKGFYTVDVRYYYKVEADAFTGCGRPTRVEGLATFSKRMVLFGSEGSVRIFSSKYTPGEMDCQTYEKTNLPTAVVEVVEPILLSVKIVDPQYRCCCDCCCINEVPEAICRCFEDQIVLEDCGRKLVATIGQFAILRLERDIQLLVPAYDICMPAKECCGSEQEDPCCLFDRFKFPVDEFFPPVLHDKPANGCGCGCTPCEPQNKRSNC